MITYLKDNQYSKFHSELQARKSRIIQLTIELRDNLPEAQRIKAELQSFEACPLEYLECFHAADKVCHGPGLLYCADAVISGGRMIDCDIDRYDFGAGDSVSCYSYLTLEIR